MVLLTTGCNRYEDRTKGVYLLVDASIGDTDRLTMPGGVINFLIGNLISGDTLMVAGIKNRSMGEKHIPAKIKFDQRPSVMMAQKRVFQKKIAEINATEENHRMTDIAGGLLQAAQHLNQTQSARKFVLIVSDFNEEMPIENEPNVFFRLEGINVIVINRSRQAQTTGDSEMSRQRMNLWQNRIQSGGGSWSVISDIAQLNPIFEA